MYVCGGASWNILITVEENTYCRVVQNDILNNI